MTLNDSRINNLYVYLTDEYQKKLQDLEFTRIKEIVKSDKYKQTIAEIESFLIDKGLNNDIAKRKADGICRIIFDIGIVGCVDSPTNRLAIGRKIKAILSTLPDSLSFEEIIKMVDEKLEFENIINKQ